MMKKILLATALLALASTPAWALPGKAPANGGTAHAPETTPVGPPSSTPSSGSDPGSKNRSDAGSEGAEHSEDHGTSSTGETGSKGSDNHSSSNDGSHGKGDRGTKGDKGAKGDKSHRCRPHAVAYVVGGTLVSQTLTEEEGSRHTYKGEVTIEVKRGNEHARADKGTTKTYTVQGVRVRGPLSVASLAAGDWAQAIGRVTVLPERCEAGEFKPTITIRQLVFHGPRRSTTTTTTTSSSTTSTSTSSTSTSTSTTVS